MNTRPKAFQDLKATGSVNRSMDLRIKLFRALMETMGELPVFYAVWHAYGHVSRKCFLFQKYEETR